MKRLIIYSVCAAACMFSAGLHAQPSRFKIRNPEDLRQEIIFQPVNHLYIDVHHLGKVNPKDVEVAHRKDLAVEKKYGVDILKYWIDDKKGDVYCLASCASPEDLRKTHAEAHGLLPDTIYEVREGQSAPLKGKNGLYLDLHQLGAGQVTAKDVADAHKKDLAVEGKYKVNFIDYWFNERTGTVICLAQAPDSMALIKTHKEAHGLVPLRVSKVKQKQ